MSKIMICGCGCEGLKREDLIQSKVNGNVAWRCPKHYKLEKGTLIYVLVICLDCGLEMKKTFKGSSNVFRCEACQKRRYRIAQRKYNKKNKEKRDKERLELNPKTESKGNSIWY